MLLYIKEAVVSQSVYAHLHNWGETARGLLGLPFTPSKQTGNMNGGGLTPGMSILSH